jgi:hypothetical protein
VTTNSSQPGPNQLGRLSAGRRSSLRVVPIRGNPLDPDSDVTEEATAVADESEALLFRPRLHFADEDIVR